MLAIGESMVQAVFYTLSKIMPIAMSELKFTFPSIMQSDFGVLLSI